MLMCDGNLSFLAAYEQKEFNDYESAPECAVCGEKIMGDGWHIDGEYIHDDESCIWYYFTREDILDIIREYLREFGTRI